MKKLITLILVLLATFAWGQNNPLDYNIVIDSKTLLVDVRTPSEFANGHIENAVNIPFNKIAGEIKYFAPDKDRTIVVYCHSGGRANAAARTLKDLGYKNIINAGTYNDLKKLEKKQK